MKYLIIHWCWTPCIEDTYILCYISIMADHITIGSVVSPKIVSHMTLKKKKTQTGGYVYLMVRNWGALDRCGVGLARTHVVYIFSRVRCWSIKHDNNAAAVCHIIIYILMLYTFNIFLILPKTSPHHQPTNIKY